MAKAEARVAALAASRSLPSIRSPHSAKAAEVNNDSRRQIFRSYWISGLCGDMARRPPGDVVITWQERRIEMSVMVLITGIMIVAVITTMLWSIVRAIMRSPDVLARHLRARRGVRGYQAGVEWPDRRGFGRCAHGAQARR